MSPRRSSRARSSQQPPTTPSASASSTSTSTLKHQRSTQRSESIEDPTADDTSGTAEPVMPRRSRRGNGDDLKEAPLPPEKLEDEELDENVEEEVTRCVCGQPEYPGPSQAIKELAGVQDLLSEDLGNFFVQCDMCSVWQHGGCVGLTDEATLPDEYFCELCKPEFHKVNRGSHGNPKTSRYLPVLETKSSRSSSLSSNHESGGRKDSTSKLSESTKKRATMNSRGAYDEDEMLRRAIEESKETGVLGKRTREDLEETRQLIKRQRTTSSSPSSETKRSLSPSAAPDDLSGRTGQNKGTSKPRTVAAKNNKEKELRDKQKEQTAAIRAEAASKRNARSERRRGEESPPPTPSLSPSKMAATMAIAMKSRAKSPLPNRNNLKGKTGRPARRGRLGRNQYTRDLPTNGDTSDTPMRETSHERNGTGGSPNGVNGINGESGRSSKAKTHPARTSMNEMKRRVAAILEFVGRMQTDRGTQPQSHQSSGSASSNGKSTPNGTSIASALPTASLVKAVQEASDQMQNGEHKTDGAGSVKMRDDREFNIMASTEMMETLAKELVAWQNVYGFYAR